MTLTRAVVAWGVMGGLVGLGSALVVSGVAATWGLGIPFVSGALSVLTVALSAAAGAGVGWGLDQAESRGKGCLAPVLAIVAAGALLSVLIPFLIGDLVSLATGSALEEARRRAPEIIRDRSITSEGLVEGGKAIGRSLIVALVAPAVALPALIVAPIAAMATTFRRSK